MYVLFFSFYINLKKYFFIPFYFSIFYSFLFLANAFYIEMVRLLRLLRLLLFS